VKDKLNMHSVHKLKDWDEIIVGDNIGTIQYRINAKDVEVYTDSLDNIDSWYIDNSPFTGAIAPPCYFCDDYLRLLIEYIDYPLDVLHSRVSHESKAPIRHGTLITVKGTIIDKYTRRGRDHIVVETLATDESGCVVSRDRNILSRPIKDNKTNDG